MHQTLTSLINLTLNYDNINQRYSMYRVSLDNSTKDFDYAKKLTLVEKLSKPLALISHSGNYWILLDKKNTPDSSSDQVSFELIQASDSYKLHLGRLFVRALGKVAPEQYFTGLGDSYVFLETDRFFKHTIYKCLKFELRESVRFHSLFIDISGVTFSPVKTVYKPQHKIDIAPKYDFDPENGVLYRSPQGNLMIHSPGNSKNTTNAIDISGKKAVSLQMSRTGAIVQFIDLMNKHFNNCLTIELKPIKADWREHYTKKDIEKIYKQIYHIIDSTGGIQIVNAALKEEGFELLRKVKWPVKVEFITNQKIDNERPKLVIVSTPKEYQDAGVTDPKQNYYINGAVTQSIIESNFTNKGLNKLSPLVDTWVKEIAIKQECNQGCFTIQKFDKHFWFVDVETTRNKEPIYHILKCKDGCFSYEQRDEYYFDELNIRLLEKGPYFEMLSYVIDMTDDAPKVCTIFHEQIIVIPDTKKLSRVLEQLEKDDQQGLSRGHIDKFITDNNESKDPLIEKLHLMLKYNPLKEWFYQEDLKSANIKYRSNLEKQFIDDYFKETGILLNYSLKGDHNEYLEALTGHFYDAEQSAYFVGNEKGGFKFSRGQFNHLRFIEGPEYLKKACLELTKSYFVRNKLATVRPFPFKHLAEYRNQAK